MPCFLWQPRNADITAHKNISFYKFNINSNFSIFLSHPLYAVGWKKTFCCNCCIFHVCSSGFCQCLLIFLYCTLNLTCSFKQKYLEASNILFFKKISFSFKLFKLTVLLIAYIFFHLFYPTLQCARAVTQQPRRGFISPAPVRRRADTLTAAGSNQRPAYYCTVGASRGTIDQLRQAWVKKWSKSTA